MDRTKALYTEKVGFTLDHDHQMGESFRVVQLTPPGSACSIAIGRGIVHTPPGSVQGLHLVVSGEIEGFGGGVSMAFFKDPDGNGWALQQIAPGAHRPDDLDEDKLQKLIGDQ